MSRAELPQTVAEVLEHFTPLEQEPEIVQRVREEVPTHFFVDDPDARHYAWCSHCGEFVNLGRSHHRTKTICPCCEARGDIIHTWRGYKGLVDKVLVYVYGKSVKSPEDTITARAIYMEYRWGQKDPLGEWELPWNMEPYVAVDSYYVFAYGQGAVQVRPVNNWKCNPDYPFIYDDLTLSKSVNSRSWVYANGAYGAQRHISIILALESIDDAVEGTPFHYVWDAVEETRNMDAYVNFFARLAKYPFAVETMIKLGRPTARWLYSLTEGNASTYGIINWRGKTLKKIFRYSITKEEKAWLRDADDTEIYCGYLFQIWQWLRKRGNTWITLMDINVLHMTIPALRAVEEIISPNRLIKYLMRQQTKNPDYTITLDIYADYIRYAKLVEMNLTEKASIMPKNLIEAHDTLMQEYRQIQELRREEMRMAENQKKKRAARAKDSLYSKLRRKIARKYAFEADGMMIYVPKKLEELIEEGVAMHSCVGNYVDRVAEGKTIVVFIRSAEDCTERIGTMEISLDGRSIIQARAKFNQNLPPEAAEFVRKFRAAKIDGNGERKTA